MSFDLSRARALFLVWSPPTHGSSRSREFSKALSINELHFVYLPLQPGPLTAPFRYLYQALQTLRLLSKKRPKIVFVQSPPSFAVLFVFLYCIFTRSHYLVDAHSGAFDIPIWSYPTWFARILARQALATIVASERHQEVVSSWGGKTIVMKDPVTTYPREEYPLNGSFNLTVVNTFSSDEPLEEVLKTAADLSDVHFYVTGKKNAADERVLAQPPSNVTFTDYLSTEQYYGLLNSSDAVMCLTTCDHTLQCGACEALSLNRPIITSNWPMLREYFYMGTVHVANSSEGIRQGIVEMQMNYDFYLSGIQKLHEIHKQSWETQAGRLVGLINQVASQVTEEKV